jgi:hypothetical protein
MSLDCQEFACRMEVATNNPGTCKKDLSMRWESRARENPPEKLNAIVQKAHIVRENT